MPVHSSDHVWQKKLLPQLLQLADEEKIFGSDVAGLTDRFAGQATTVCHPVQDGPRENSHLAG